MAFEVIDNLVRVEAVFFDEKGLFCTVGGSDESAAISAARFAPFDSVLRLLAQELDGLGRESVIDALEARREECDHSGSFEETFTEDGPYMCTDCMSVEIPQPTTPRPSDDHFWDPPGEWVFDGGVF